MHNPIERPTADTWEQALIKTNDLKLQCSNSKCEQKWFIFNNTKIMSVTKILKIVSTGAVLTGILVYTYTKIKKES